MSKPLQTSDIHFGAFIALVALLVSLMALSVDIICLLCPQLGKTYKYPRVTTINSSLFNAKLVMKYGMHDMSKYALFIITLTSIVFFWFSSQSNGNPALWQLMVHLAIVLFCFGILMGNLNAPAMKPLGHMAGIGASLVGAVSTFIAVPFGAIIGQSYAQSVPPLVLGFLTFSLLSLLVMFKLKHQKEDI